MDLTEPLASPSLAERAIRRDGRAFEALVRPQLASMLRTATAILGDETDALDAVQDALASAWREISSLREPDRFEPWLARILVHQCRHAARHRMRQRVREIRLGPVPGDDPASIELRAGDDVDRTVVSRAVIERAFGRLSTADRAVLVLHHLDERPLREIAIVLGVPEGTVKSRLHTARQALERSLARELR